MKMVDFLVSMENDPIMCENVFPMRKRTFLSDRQVKHVQYIFVSRDITHIGVGKK